MSDILDRNAEYASVMKEVLNLRGEPVAIKLVKEGEEYPAGYSAPESQMSHCQAVFAAKDGESLLMPLESQGCKVGSSALGMNATPEKVATGEFHANIGIHDTQAAAEEMIAKRVAMPDNKGEVVCPLKDADFEPDVVAIIDIPERIYWIVPLSTAAGGGRMQFSTSPFQCACEDVTAVPFISGAPNVSLGCFGCRKKTSMAADELACGIPYSLIPGYVQRLKEKYSSGVMLKAKRD
ncbi:MAG: DUF169 domain-containing protein [Candidatus Methanomethylophilaceae archaeon]|jgi:uncharacterized protein (DUF169 family)|nr:DUF169 domain-containing protein [Candidatus Methanomethylophilaceae archaeon]